MIKISDKASQALSELYKEHHMFLNVKVSSGGCHGFGYDVGLVTGHDVHPKCIFIPCHQGGGVYIDPAGQELFRGSLLDYKDELLQKHFFVTDNPQATQACSCGRSFGV